MPWFECQDCNESLKKPKIEAHLGRCSGSAFSCLDCGTTFTRYTVGGHTSCVTEHQKYAQGATKPGGFAAQGFASPAPTPSLPKEGEGGHPGGLEFLSERPPWRCTLCNTACTSRATLLGHASGAKHLRKVRGAQKAAAGDEPSTADTPSTPPPPIQKASAETEPAPPRGPEHPPQGLDAEVREGSGAQQAEGQEEGMAGGEKKRRKEKKRKAPPGEPPVGCGPQGGVAGESEKKRGRVGGGDAALSPAILPAVLPAEGTEAAPAGPAAGEGEGEGGAGGMEGKGGGGAGGGRRPWKKLAAKALVANKGKLKMKVGKLQRKVLQLAGVGEEGEEAEACKEQMLACWQGSRRFKLEEAKGMVHFLGVPDK